jgi:hypothetical protein
MMGWFIGGLILPSCLIAAWLIVRKPLRQVVEDLGVDQARLAFHRRREWLEAGFLTSLAKSDPIERLRWEGAHWHNEVHWGRDSQTRRLLALVEIHFEPDVFETNSLPMVNHATALFEYRRGRWFADGKRLDATRPDEAFLRLGRYEPVAPPQRRA